MGWGKGVPFLPVMSYYNIVIHSFSDVRWRGEERNENMKKKREKDHRNVGNSSETISVTIQIDNRITFLLGLLSPTDLTTETSLDRRDGTP
jgi:hypothetical protein